MEIISWTTTLFNVNSFCHSSQMLKQHWHQPTLAQITTWSAEWIGQFQTKLISNMNGWLARLPLLDWSNCHGSNVLCCCPSPSCCTGLCLPCGARLAELTTSCHAGCEASQAWRLCQCASLEWVLHRRWICSHRCAVCVCVCFLSLRSASVVVPNR